MKLRGVRVLYTLQDIFEHVRRARTTEAGLLAASSLFGLATAEAVSFGSGLGWIARDGAGQIHPTEAGLAAHPQDTRSLQLRCQLRAFILQTKPSWSALLCRGRREAAIMLPAEIRQCLQDAGLLEGTDEATVRWWDGLSVAARIETQQELLAIGRFGERLSLNYEKSRVAAEPLWQALESNAAGYDILSWLSRGAPERLSIEVKCTVLPRETACFHVTRYEWQTAVTTKHFVFHLWQVGSESRALWIRSPSQIAPHTPSNSGSGEWECVQIPLAPLTAEAPDFTEEAATSVQALSPDSMQ